MYYLEKTFELSAAHQLSHLEYESKCKNLHGHNWEVTVFVKGQSLNRFGMLIDFTEIKKLLQDPFDHCMLNEKISPATAEVMAKTFFDLLNNFFKENKDDYFDAPTCYAIKVVESANNIVWIKNNCPKCSEKTETIE